MRAHSRFGANTPPAQASLDSPFSQLQPRYDRDDYYRQNQDGHAERHPHQQQQSQKIFLNQQHASRDEKDMDSITAALNQFSIRDFARGAQPPQPQPTSCPATFRAPDLGSHSNNDAMSRLSLSDSASSSPNVAEDANVSEVDSDAEENSDGCDHDIMQLEPTQLHSGYFFARNPVQKEQQQQQQQQRSSSRLQHSLNLNGVKHSNNSTNSEHSRSHSIRNPPVSPTTPTSDKGAPSFFTARTSHTATRRGGHRQNLLASELSALCRRLLTLLAVLLALHLVSPNSAFHICTVGLAALLATHAARETLLLSLALTRLCASTTWRRLRSCNKRRRRHRHRRSRQHNATDSYNGGNLNSCSRGEGWDDHDNVEGSHYDEPIDIAAGTMPSGAASISCSPSSPRRRRMQRAMSAAHPSNLPHRTIAPLAAVPQGRRAAAGLLLLVCRVTVLCAAAALLLHSVAYSCSVQGATTTSTTFAEYFKFHQERLWESEVLTVRNAVPQGDTVCNVVADLSTAGTRASERCLTIAHQVSADIVTILREAMDFARRMAVDAKGEWDDKYCGDGNAFGACRATTCPATGEKSQ